MKKVLIVTTVAVVVGLTGCLGGKLDAVSVQESYAELQLDTLESLKKYEADVTGRIEKATAKLPTADSIEIAVLQKYIAKATEVREKVRKEIARREADLNSGS